VLAASPNLELLRPLVERRISAVLSRLDSEGTSSRLPRVAAAQG